MFWQLLKLVTHCTGQKVDYGKKEDYYSKSELLSLFSKGLMVHVLCMKPCAFLRTFKWCLMYQKICLEQNLPSWKILNYSSLLNTLFRCLRPLKPTSKVYKILPFESTLFLYIINVLCIVPIISGSRYSMNLTPMKILHFNEK